MIFHDHHKDHDLRHCCINLLVKKAVSFYFTAMFRFWCLQLTNPNKHGLLNLSLHFSMLKQWPSTQEHVLKFHSLNAGQMLIIQTERFRESSCKHYKTAVLVEKNPTILLACHLGSLMRKYGYLACYKKI